MQHIREITNQPFKGAQLNRQTLTKDSRSDGLCMAANAYF